MTERKMTPKGFLSKLNGAKSAIGFIAAHREYLTTGELAAITSPIVAKVDAGTTMPTPALAEIASAVFAHVMKVEGAKAEASILNAAEPKEPKNFIATVRDSLGAVVVVENDKGDLVTLEKDFDMPQDAERWVDRRLFDGAPDWYAEIVWLKCPEKLDKLRTVTREESMERVLRGRPLAAHKTIKVGTSGGLGFGVKVRNDHAKFSRG